MLSELKGIINQELSIVSFQVILIGSNLYLIFDKDIHNSYLALSIACILSLFLLQVISRRFTLPYPIQSKLNKPTQMIDTYILKILLVISVAALFAGASSSWVNELQKVEAILTPINKWAIPVLVIFLPLSWLFFFDEHTRNRLVKKLQVESITVNDFCSNCKKQREIIIKVLNQNQLSEEYKCECGEHKINSNINIGY